MGIESSASPPPTKRSKNIGAGARFRAIQDAAKRYDEKQTETIRQLNERANKASEGKTLPGLKPRQRPYYEEEQQKIAEEWLKKQVRLNPDQTGRGWDPKEPHQPQASTGE